MLVPTVLFSLLMAIQTAPVAQVVDCRDEAHRALDFWLGTWDVYDTRSDTKIAESRVETIAGDCALRETYTQSIGANGQPVDYLGTSYSALNGADGTWRQLYVDTAGAALSYTGGIQDRAMVLTARAARLGTRMTLRPQADGSVRQSGDVTKDDGVTWAPGYDFTYRRHKAGQ